MKSESDIAQSATGTCHGPIIWSLAIRPVTERSAIVIKKLLLAIVGSASRRLMASLIEILLASKTFSALGRVTTSLCVLGDEPKSSDISRSIGLFSKYESSRVKCLSSVALPKIA